MDGVISPPLKASRFMMLVWGACMGFELREHVFDVGAATAALAAVLQESGTGGDEACFDGVGEGSQGVGCV